jgi:hypothetical protein
MMHKPGVRGSRLACLFVLGWALFCYPFLAVFNVHAMVFGVPVLYAYLFSTWLLVIVLAAAVVSGPD